MKTESEIWLEHLEMLANEARKDGSNVWKDVILDYEKEELELIYHPWYLNNLEIDSKWRHLNSQLSRFGNDWNYECLSLKTQGKIKGALYYRGSLRQPEFFKEKR